MAVDLTTLPNNAPEFDLKEMLEAGIHFGHQTRKWHPAMKEFIYTAKDDVHIIDLPKTAAQLTHAYNFAYDLGKHSKNLVFVATKRQARDIVRTAAEEAGAMFITARWLGGLLTNWEQVSKSLRRMLDLETGLETDAFKGYTKFERNQMDKERERLQRFFGGIRGLKARPDALMIVDPGREKNAILEAVSVGMPVMGLVDTNSDPRQLDIAIPGNDDAAASIEFIVKAVAAGYKAGRDAR